MEGSGKAPVCSCAVCLATGRLQRDGHRLRGEDSSWLAGRLRDLHGEVLDRLERGTPVAEGGAVPEPPDRAERPGVERPITPPLKEVKSEEPDFESGSLGVIGGSGVQDKSPAAEEPGSDKEEAEEKREGEKTPVGNEEERSDITGKPSQTEEEVKEAAKNKKPHKDKKKKEKKVEEVVKKDKDRKKEKKQETPEKRPRERTPVKKAKRSSSRRSPGRSPSRKKAESAERPRSSGRQRKRRSRSPEEERGERRKRSRSPEEERRERRKRSRSQEEEQREASSGSRGRSRGLTLEENHKRRPRSPDHSPPAHIRRQDHQGVTPSAKSSPVAEYPWGPPGNWYNWGWDRHPKQKGRVRRERWRDIQLHGPSDERKKRREEGA